jgi:hypothetical protein
MTIRSWTSAIALLLLLVSGSTPLTAEKQGPESNREWGHNLRGLEPGKFVTYRHEVPIDIVLIGFDSLNVSRNDIRSVLPDRYSPIVRYPQFYGLEGRNMGLDYSFDYSISRASQGLTNRFFTYLGSIGTPIQPTTYQLRYNAQATNLVDVTGPVLDIEAARVERWLEQNADPRRAGYTIYFINWYGRKDFRFHIYTKKDDPDPDTRFNFGATASRAITSWGGSTSRTWFYDFSAGPEWNTVNWVVDQTDLDGDGEEDYRMPPSWEYSIYGYRSPALLGHDMGLLARFVAINLLFTTSPLYDPMTTAPDPLGRKIVDMTMFEDDPASKGMDFIDANFARARWQEFEPYHNWKTALRAVDPIDPGARNALNIFTLNDVTPDCWVPYGAPFAQLFCYFAGNLGTYVPDYSKRDYVVPVFNFNTTEEGMGAQLGLLGFADDNWIDGTQSFVFSFGAKVYRDSGFGFTATAVHEVGHHIGMSHPHDGYDSELGLDYGPSGEFLYAWEGDESDTVMQYLSITNKFGEHNRDNMYRWETAGYLNWSNALAGAIMESEDAWKVFLLVHAADTLAARARSKFDSWQYLSAVNDARLAYGLLVTAADAIGVSSSRLSAARMMLPPSQIEKYVCRPRALIEALANR